MSDPTGYKAMFEMKQNDWLDACGEIDQLKAKVADYEKAHVMTMKAMDILNKQKKSLESLNARYKDTLESLDYSAICSKCESNMQDARKALNDGAGE